MFDLNFIWFYLCFVAVPQIAWSARVNTTASDGKVIISGNHNEVVVSTDRDNKIALAKIKSSLESVKKSNEELFSRLQNISQRLSAQESRSMNLSSLESSKGGSTRYQPITAQQNFFRPISIEYLAHVTSLTSQCPYLGIKIT